ncbi:Histone acetyltransferase HAC1 [Vitis vinifera]|uniref:histone acetyltransferase n=1 Tax=Vitis vinifera TaxID=29760 RepID=A0A438FH61_VITVI|nr:Histone acetyltransferase HAC1 [Vitis vinifera]
MSHSTHVDHVMAKREYWVSCLAWPLVGHVTKRCGNGNTFIYALGLTLFGYLTLQLRKMLDLLVHASQCRSPHCQYPNCRKVKGLFRHGIQCKTRASGGCLLCKKMWYLLQLHARACKESECHVPRCRDLKEHLRRLQQQSDSRRRAAVMEMMRQRAAEVAGNAG